MKLKKIPVSEIQADLNSIESEFQEVIKIKTKKKRIEWAKRNPEKWKKIYAVALKYEIQEAIEILERLLEDIQERLGPEKRRYEAIIKRIPIPNSW